MALTNEAFVRALYLGLLGREPEDEGLAHHLDTLSPAPTPRESAALIESFLASPEFAGGHGVPNLPPPRANGPPFTHIASLGSHCYVSQTLKFMGLKRYSLPFDWIFSSPRMIAQCLADDCAALLDPAQYRVNPLSERPGPRERVCEHLGFRRQFGLQSVFNHADPTDPAVHAYLTRCVARWHRLLASPDRKLFLCVVNHRLPLKVAEEFPVLLRALERKTTNFVLEIIVLGPPREDGGFAHHIMEQTGPHRISVLRSFGRMQAILFDEVIDELFMRRLIACHPYDLAATV